ncbi:uncharacterized protein LOC121839433, partial [Oncorhynchus tshawytscha]|uniref:uncharacterized protein LOC121839433 n=1 Tax=Oncorhynchus tshawytscha TaxID=74940 RepID=UPI001C3C2575
MLPSRDITVPHVTFSGTGVADEDMTMGEVCPQKRTSTKNYIRLLLLILVPVISLLTCLLLVLLAFSGIFGNVFFMGVESGESDPLFGTAYPVSTDTPFTAIGTSPVNPNVPDPNRPDREHNLKPTGTHYIPHTDTTVTHSSSSSSYFSSTTPPTVVHTDPRDWVTSMTSLGTSLPISTTQDPSSPASNQDCALISEAQCTMLPYNQTSQSPGLAVVRSSEVDMFLKFF